MGCFASWASSKPIKLDVLGQSANNSAMRILELNHVAIHVENVEKSCEFYSNVLKLEPMSRPAFDFPGAWFRLGRHQELHIIGRRDLPVHSHNRGNHFALQADDLGPW